MSAAMGELREDHWPPRILIIDDNPSIHRDFELVFLDESENAELDADEQRLYGTPAARAESRTEYALAHAGSGQEAIDLVTREKAAGRFFQLAFVDIRMPGMDGVETIERLWRIDPRMQMVICTAYADYSQEDLTQRLGHTDKLLLLKKPFDSIEVTQLARTLSEKWYLAWQAALRLEQMEWIVAQRTQQWLELRGGATGRREMPEPEAEGDLEREGERGAAALLVSSDAEMAREIARRMSGDLQVTVAGSEAAGWEQARDAVPDVIMIDSGAAGREGAGLCRRLKADLVTSHIPIILLGPGEEAEHRTAAREAGADDYLGRAKCWESLEGRVGKLLQARRAGRARWQAGSATTRASWRARESALGGTDARFLQRVAAVVEQHMSDFEFDVEALARMAAVSRRQLFRKLKALVDTTPKALIRSVRLERAAQLLGESKLTVTEITFAVGFLDVKHFRAVFKQEFGVLPSEFAQGREGGAAGAKEPPGENRI